MKFSKKEKRFWKTKFSFNGLKSIPEEMDHMNLKDEYFTNEELCFITSRIKHIVRLDLDSNPIDDDGIPCLLNMDYIGELRLKNLEISDESIESLSKLTSLKLLHLGSTNVTCNRIEELTNLNKLKALFISPKEVDKEKLEAFKRKMPGCSLTINSKPY
jgi:Leucine-rich repeat (LRR) protein